MGRMPESEPTPQRSRIAAAKERAERAKTVILAAAVIAFFGAMAAESGARHSSNGSQPAVTSDESDDFGFFDDGGLAPSHGKPPASTQTS
jgi:hypothetical protein